MIIVEWAAPLDPHPTWSLAWARTHGVARMGTHTRRWAAQGDRTRWVARTRPRTGSRGRRGAHQKLLVWQLGQAIRKPTSGVPSFEHMAHACEQGFDVRPREGRESPREPREGQGPMEGRWVATARPDTTYPTHPFHTPTSHPPDTTPTHTHTRTPPAPLHPTPPPHTPPSHPPQTSPSSPR